MKRRDFLRIGTLGVGSLALAPSQLDTVAFSGAAISAKGDDRVNIIMLITDDTLWDEYQFHNPKTAYTPTMQQLADEGVCFTNCFAGGSTCAPARFSLFSGRQPYSAIDPGTLEAARHRNGYIKIVNGGSVLLYEYNVARVLRKAGYLTGIIGKTDGIEKSGFHKIEPDWEPDNPKVEKKLKENQEIRQKQMKEFGFDYPLYVHRGNIQTHFATRKNAFHNVEYMTSKALEFLDIAAKENKPFFLVYATSLMHAPKPYESLTKGNPLATEAGSLKEPVTGVQPSRQSCIDRVKKRGIEPNRVAAMLWLDDSLAAIMKKLKEIEADENTVIVLVNDNGHDNYGKGSIYYDGFHVPLVIRWPKGIVSPGRKETRLVRSFDLVPTFMELASDRKPDRMVLHGRSLVPLLKNHPPKDWRTSVFMPYGFARAVLKGDYHYIAVRFPENHDNIHPIKNKPGNGLAEKHKKLLEKAGNRKGMTSGATMTKAELNQYGVHGESYFDADQLYNIKNDPLEKNNLAKNPEYAPVLKEMRELLKEYMMQMPGSFGEFKTEDPEYIRFLEENLK